MSEQVATSVQDLLREAGATLSDGSCDRCSNTLMLSDVMLLIGTEHPEHFHIDIGGYCPGCHQFICPEHAEFRPMQKAVVVRHFLGSGSPRVPDSVLARAQFYWLACAQCHQLLELGADAEKGVMIFWDPALAQ